MDLSSIENISNILFYIYIKIFPTSKIRVNFYYKINFIKR